MRDACTTDTHRPSRLRGAWPATAAGGLGRSATVIAYFGHVEMPARHVRLGEAQPQRLTMQPLVGCIAAVRHSVRRRASARAKTRTGPAGRRECLLSNRHARPTLPPNAYLLQPPLSPRPFSPTASRKPLPILPVPRVEPASLARVRNAAPCSHSVAVSCRLGAAPRVPTPVRRAAARAAHRTCPVRRGRYRRAAGERDQHAARCSSAAASPSALAARSGARRPARCDEPRPYLSALSARSDRPVRSRAFAHWQRDGSRACLL